jgi:hypothetical protein
MVKNRYNQMMRRLRKDLMVAESLLSLGASALEALSGRGEAGGKVGGELLSVGSRLEAGGEGAVVEGELQRRAAGSTRDVEGESEVGKAAWWSPDAMGGMLGEYEWWVECVM